MNGGQADGVFDRWRQVELGLVQGQFAGLDGRDIEDFVDQFEQVAGGALDVRRIFGIALVQRAEIAVPYDLREADDRVQGRA